MKLQQQHWQQQKNHQLEKFKTTKIKKENTSGKPTEKQHQINQQQHQKYHQKMDPKYNDELHWIKHHIGFNKT